MAIVVFDIGKTNLKLSLVEGGAIRHTLSQPNVNLPGPPYLHFDTEATWAFLLRGLNKLAAMAKITDIVPVAHGAAGVLGNLVAGRLVDRRPGPVLAVLIAVVAVSLAVLTLPPSHGAGPVTTVAAVLAWGAAFTAVPVCLQSAVLRVTPLARDAASAVYVVAFQIGIGGGALVGERFVRIAGLPPQLFADFSGVDVPVVLRHLRAHRVEARLRLQAICQRFIEEARHPGQQRPRRR